MGLANNIYQIPQYISDLGVTINNVGVKIQSDAPKLSTLYSEKTGVSVCSNPSTFIPRRLQVTFNDGRELLYPLPTIKDMKDFLQELMPSILDNAIPGTGADEGACINLLGEEWSIIPGSIALGEKSGLTLPSGKLQRETGTYQYNSDVFGTIRLRYAVEKPATGGGAGDLASLISCQKKGLEDLQPGNKAGCGGYELKPRRIIIKNTAANDQVVGGVSQVSRQAIASSNGSANALVALLQGKDPASVADGIKNCAECIGYVGESVRNIHLSFNAALFG